MASKGYTLNYFINFFREIPATRWTTGTMTNNAGRFDAIGHCARHGLANPKTATLHLTSAKIDALVGFLGSPQTVEQINDGKGKYKALGKTPRTRVVRALRNRKRYGNVMGL